MRSSTRRLLLISAPASLVLGLLPGPAVMPAGAQTVGTWTGCYNGSNGTINRLATGGQPLKPCAPGDVLVSLSAGDITSVAAGTGLEGGGANRLIWSPAPAVRLS